MALLQPTFLGEIKKIDRFTSPGGSLSGNFWKYFFIFHIFERPSLGVLVHIRYVMHSPMIKINSSLSSNSQRVVVLIPFVFMRLIYFFLLGQNNASKASVRGKERDREKFCIRIHIFFYRQLDFSSEPGVANEFWENEAENCLVVA